MNNAVKDTEKIRMSVKLATYSHSAADSPN